jgi:CHAT domain-containing protein/predicted negative regulator of RcsB-dependent stress response
MFEKNHRWHFLLLPARTIYALQLSVFLALTTFGQQRANEIHDLPPDQLIEQAMTGGQTDRYSLELKTGEFFRVDIEQKGIDVLLVLCDVNGKEIVRRDSPNGRRGFEILSFVAPATGKFLLEVSSPQRDFGKAAYTIRRMASRLATPEDRQQVAEQDERQIKANELVRLFEEVSQLEGGIRPSTSEKEFQLLVKKALRGLELAQQLENRKAEALFSVMTARMYDGKVDLKNGLEYYERTLKIINSDAETKKSMKFMEVGTFRRMGLIYDNDQEDYNEAIALYKRGLSLYQASEEDVDKGLLFRALGDSLLSLGLHQEAIDAYTQSIDVFRNLKLQFELGASLGDLGLAYLQQEDTPAEGLKYFLESEKLLAESPANSKFQEKRLFNLGYIRTLYENLQDREQATLYRLKAAELEKTNNGPNVIFTNRFQFAKSLVSAGKPEDALKVYKEALTVAEHTDEPVTAKTQVLERMIRLYVTLGKYAEAQTAYDQAYELLEKLSDHSELALLDEMFGDVLFHGQAFELAASYYRQAFSELMSEKHRPKQINFSQIAQVQHKWGRAQLQIDKQSDGLINLHVALVLEMSLSFRKSLANMLDDQMSIFAKLDKKRLAIFFGKLAISVKQERRQIIKSFPVDTQKAFLKGNRDTFENLVALLLQEDRAAEAIEIINLYESEEFYDFDNTDRFSGGVSLTERERPAMAELRRLQTSLRSSKENVINNPDGSKLDKILTQIETDFSHARDDTDKGPEVPYVGQLQAALRQLEATTHQRTAAIHTLISEKQFVVILVLPDGRLKSLEFQIEATDLNRKLLQFYAVLQSPRYDPRPLGKELYDIIFKRIEVELKNSGVQTLMWQLDGNLRYVPMAALWDGTQYLAERYQNVVFTRANPERLTQDVSAKWTGVGFGSGKPRTIDLFKDGRDVFSLRPLPGANAVLQSVFRANGNRKGMFEGDVLLDDDFSEKAFYDAMKRRPSLVFISSHFVFRPGDDSRSFLLLGDGTPLPLNRLKEHQNLFAGVELLTLSACNTAATQPNSNGKEIDGFAELAQRLGANAVMATLWQVSEGSTYWLMQEFYASKVSKPETTKARALKDAQLTLLNGTANVEAAGQRMGGSGDFAVKVVVVPDASKQNLDLTGAVVYVSEKDAPVFKQQDAKPFAHPYYWAPFVLYGNWK